MWNLRNKTNEQRKRREREKEKPRIESFIESKLMVTGRRVGGGMS